MYPGSYREGIGLGRFDHLEMGNRSVPRADIEPQDAGLVDENVCVEKADQAFADEEFERSLSLYSRALQYNANMESAWLGQLRCLIEMQELQESVVWSDRAQERFPKSGDILAARAVAEARSGRNEAAMGYSDAAFSESKTCTPFMWIARGEVLLNVSASNARACFLKAVEASPRDSAVQAWIARSYMVRRLCYQAIEHYRNAVRLDSNRFSCWYWIGKCSESLGDVQEAERSYMRCVAIQPKFIIARDALSELRKRGIIWKLINGIKHCFR